MPKRKRSDGQGPESPGTNEPCVASECQTTPRRRRSAHVQGIAAAEHDPDATVAEPCRLPSPPATSLEGQVLPEQAGIERPPVKDTASTKGTSINGEKANTSSHQAVAGTRTRTRSDNPVAYWAETNDWPPNFAEKGRRMSSEKSNKRKSDSSHRSDRLSRLEQNGIFMRASRQLRRESKEFCDQLLAGDKTPIGFPVFPVEQVGNVLARVDSLNETRIQRDVMPWVVPSAENLHFCGVPGMELIGDELSAEWTRCASLGSTCPKPDYAAGLLRAAFSTQEFQKLQNYATASRPVLFTPELAFPFLICEAKNGDEGLNKAHRQNIHSASIAMKAIIELCSASYGRESPVVEDLYGQVLVFTVSHNHDSAYLYGHYAILNQVTNSLEFYRHPIGLFSFVVQDGRDRFQTYNFVRNVYELFAPQHLKRIKDAVANLPVLEPRTGLSVATSEMGLSEATSPQQDSQQASNQGVFKKPTESYSTWEKREMTSLRLQIEKLGQQLEQQREDNRKQREEHKKQLEQQREDSMKQLERQRQDSAEIISLLKASQRV